MVQDFEKHHGNVIRFKENIDFLSDSETLSTLAKDSFDIVDLKTGHFELPVLETFKSQAIFTKVQIRNTAHIYLLSECGYAKKPKPCINKLIPLRVLLTC